MNDCASMSAPAKICDRIDHQDLHYLEGDQGIFQNSRFLQNQLVIAEEEQTIKQACYVDKQVSESFSIMSEFIRKTPC